MGSQSKTMAISREEMNWLHSKELDTVRSAVGAAFSMADEECNSELCRNIIKQKEHFYSSLTEILNQFPRGIRSKQHVDVIVGQIKQLGKSVSSRLRDTEATRSFLVAVRRHHEQVRSAFMRLLQQSLQGEDKKTEAKAIAEPQGIASNDPAIPELPTITAMSDESPPGVFLAKIESIQTKLEAAGVFSVPSFDTLQVDTATEKQPKAATENHAENPTITTAQVQQAIESQPILSSNENTLVHKSMGQTISEVGAAIYTKAGLERMCKEAESSIKNWLKSEDFISAMKGRDIFLEKINKRLAHGPVSLTHLEKYIHLEQKHFERFMKRIQPLLAPRIYDALVRAYEGAYEEFYPQIRNLPSVRKDAPETDHEQKAFELSDEGLWVDDVLVCFDHEIMRTYAHLANPSTSKDFVYKRPVRYSKKDEASNKDKSRRVNKISRAIAREEHLMIKENPALKLDTHMLVNFTEQLKTKMHQASKLLNLTDPLERTETVQIAAEFSRAADRAFSLLTDVLKKQSAPKVTETAIPSGSSIVIDTESADQGPSGHVSAIDEPSDPLLQTVEPVADTTLAQQLNDTALLPAIDEVGAVSTHESAQEILKLQTENESLRSALAALQNDLHEQRRLREEAEKALAIQRDSTDAARASVIMTPPDEQAWTELLEQQKAVEDDAEVVVSQLHELSIREASLAERENQFFLEKDAVRQDREALAHDHIIADAKSVELASIEQRLLEMRRELENGLRDLGSSQAKASVMKLNLEKEKESLQRDRRSLQENMEAYSRQNLALQEAADAFNQKILEVNQRELDVASRNTALESLLTEAATKQQSLADEKKTLDESGDILQKISDDLCTKELLLHAREQRLSDQTKELESSQSQLAMQESLLENEKFTLQAQASELRGAADALAAREAQVLDREQQIEAQRVEILTLRKVIDGERKEIGQLRQMLEAEKLQLAGEREELNQLLETLEADKLQLAEERSELSGEWEELEQQREEVESEKEDIEDTMAKSQLFPEEALPVPAATRAVKMPQNLSPATLEQQHADNTEASLRKKIISHAGEMAASRQSAADTMTALLTAFPGRTQIADDKVLAVALQRCLPEESVTRSIEKIREFLGILSRRNRLLQELECLPPTPGKAKKNDKPLGSFISNVRSDTSVELNGVFYTDDEFAELLRKSLMCARGL